MLYICCICGKKKEGYGNSAWPLYPDDSAHRCCDNCNKYIIVPERKAGMEDRSDNSVDKKEGL